jgi:radical SAM superfamily enzyme YgiQ (UPF0313 family)
MQWGKYKSRSPKDVAEELINLYNSYSSQLFFIVDSLLNPIMNELACELLKQDKVVYWDGSLRVSDMVGNVHDAILWRRGGFYRARMGIETGSQRLLDLMDKRISIEQIRKSISSLAYAGIKTTTFWVVGYPGETEEDFQQTLDLIEELKDDIYETTFRPLLYYKSKRPKFGVCEKSKKLYPDYAKDKVLIETWIPDIEPSREETYGRLNRFHEHITKLGIPNPYSLYELEKADIRWKKLHDNAVPSILELKGKNQYVDECRSIGEIQLLDNSLVDTEDFAF